jgi:hypothetical protein
MMEVDMDCCGRFVELLQGRFIDVMVVRARLNELRKEIVDLAVDINKPMTELGYVT